MGYMQRQIVKQGRWVEGYIPAPPQARQKPRAVRTGPPRPSALARAFAELTAHRQDERAKKAAAAMAEVRVRKPTMWAKVRGTVGGLFRRKV